MFRALLAGVLFVPATTFAQVHPNLEKGFSPDKMYQFGDVDHVNLFNGNLTMTIPIGGSTPISDHLATSMTLVYNSKLWDVTTKLDQSVGDENPNRVWKKPTARSNAGLGWLLSFGRMFEGSSNTLAKDSDIVEDSSIHYESPDGSDHVLHTTPLHTNDLTTDYYTRDGSYIRMTAGNPRLASFHLTPTAVVSGGGLRSCAMPSAIT
jgi:hypothetical protein